MKKAFLVTFCPTTRVVVDIEEDQFDASLINSVSIEDENKLMEIINLALDNMVDDNNVGEYLNSENIYSIALDEELPYPQDFDLQIK